MKELYDSIVRVGAALSVMVGVGGLGALMGLDVNGHLLLATLTLLIVFGATQVQMLKRIERGLNDEE